MPIVTSLILAGCAVAAGLAAHRKSKPPLVKVLINGEPKTGILLPPPTQQTLTLVQKLTQDLFGDTRQQYQQALNAKV